MANLNIETAKSIEILCNKKFNKFKSYKLVEHNGELFVAPNVKETLYMLDALDDVDEEGKETVNLMIEHATNFIIDLISIRDAYSRKGKSILDFDNWDQDLLEEVCYLILSLVHKYGQLGIVHHIIYDYVKPELSIKGEYKFPTVLNPFFIQIKDGYHLRPSKIMPNISYNEIIHTFFPCSKSINVFDLANNLPWVKNRYHEPIYYYIVVAEILHLITNSDGKINEAEIALNNALFTVFGRGKSFKINNASLTFSYNSNTDQYDMTYSFKSYFDFALFILLLSKTKNGKPFARCANEKCGKLFVKTRTSKTYCSNDCKRSVNNKKYHRK